MTFEEIFSEPGIYKAEGFAKGSCFEVTEDKILMLLSYESPDDLMPRRENALMYAGLFKKDYEKVYTRQSLFK